MMDVFCSLSGSEELVPTHALLLYQVENWRARQRQDGELQKPKPGEMSTSAVTLHEIRRSDVGEMDLAPGKLVNAADLRMAAGFFQGKKTKRRVLPERLLWHDNASMAWWVPSARRPIFFARTKGLVELSGSQVLHPALVIEVSRAGLRVFALEKSERPTAETPLYRSPYYNIYGSGMMCRGNATYPKRIDPDDLAIWEEALFGTNFTHPNVTPMIVGHVDGNSADRASARLWRRMASQRAKAFPTEVLIRTHRSDIDKKKGLAVTAKHRAEGKCITLGDLM